MKKIGIISDTHNYLDEAVFTHFKNVDEIWHAGDFGSAEIAEKLSNFKPLRGVYGNIDGYDIRSIYPLKLRFRIEEVEVLMTHIGGYPGRYDKAIKDELIARPPQLFVCGHSHILKIIYDPKLKCLHINPGAAGKYGMHKVRTLVRLTIDGSEMKDCQIIELNRS